MTDHKGLITSEVNKTMNEFGFVTIVRKYIYVERAKSGRSKCKMCDAIIPKDDKRLVIGTFEVYFCDKCAIRIIESILREVEMK